jgi:hypothetical protein
MIELRFFAGLSEEETAEALKMSPRSVKRDWTLAKIWLSRELRRGSEAELDMIKRAQSTATRAIPMYVQRSYWPGAINIDRIRRLVHSGGRC